VRAPLYPLFAALECSGLHKVFDTRSGPVVAVKQLTLSLYEGQILVLLAPNGGGKSTTVAMLRGLLSPTSGDVRVYGKSLKQDLAAAQALISACPQV
jgi:ABC-type multidrug transport system ATPase subunit